MKLQKRVFDFILATLGLLLLAPVFVLIALLIWLTDGRPVFYLHKRVGKNGKSFFMYKFRSMRNSKEDGAQLTVDIDPRITSIGHFIRKYKIDELPQLINVLKGEMSFVGPRPEVEKYVALYTAEQKKVLEFMPGITDLASLTYRNESELLAQQANPEKYYIEVILPHKAQLNLQYGSTAGLISDLKLIMKTVLASLKYKLEDTF